MRTRSRLAALATIHVALLASGCSVPGVTFTGTDGGDDDDGDSGDTTPPETTITSAPPATDNSATAIFEFMSSEAGTFECALDGAAFATCTSPHTVSGLDSATHGFEVRAVDGAGNRDATPASHTWTVDLLLPDTTIDTGPTGAVNTTDATFTFSSPNGGATVSFECSLDSAAFAACTSPTTFAGLADGAHELRVRARSTTGQLDPSPATRSWTVDTTAPDTTIANGPSGTTAMATAVFVFSSSEPGLDGKDIRSGMGAVARQAQGCFDQHGVAGHVKIKATVDPSGKVTKADAQGEFAGTPTGACVAAAAKSASFPAWTGAPMTISYGFTLTE